MAEPTILFNSATGSDTNSGAGPSTAITSTSGSTDSAGTVVTIPNANLSAVAVDGSHAVYISGHGLRKITAKADSGLSTANVTVSTAYGTSLSGLTVAIGGVRQYLFGSTRAEIESSCEEGWTLELAAGHSESLTAPTSLSFGSTRDNPITIRGDETDRAHFLNIHNSFTYSFNFNGSDGLRIENVDFEHYRGSSVGDEGEAYYIVYVGSNAYLKNCSVTAAKMYQSQALFYSGTEGNVHFINCDAKFIESSTWKYLKGTGFGGRQMVCINCSAKYLETGFGFQTFGSYQSAIAFCEADVKYGIKTGNGYDQGGTITGNVFKLQDTGYFFRFNSSWLYFSTSSYQIFNNVVTSSGSYTSVSLNGDTNTYKYLRVPIMNNCFHNGTMDSDIDDFVQVNNISTDPSLSGDAGSFVVESQDVIDHVGVAPTQRLASVPEAAGTSVYPFNSFAQSSPEASLHPLRSS